MSAPRSSAPGAAWAVRLAVLVVLGGATVMTAADADLWGHLTFGRDIVASGEIVQTDQYSFTSDRPWVNHEWLAEVAFYQAYRIGGSAGLIAFKCALVWACLGLIWWFVRRHGASRNLAVGLVALAFVSTYWRTHTVRPQLFSVWLFTALLVVLAEVDAGRRRRLLWLAPVIMALWVNLHGGWIVGLGILGVWTAARVIDGRLTASARAQFAILGASAAIATLANPHGLEMWSFLAETVRFDRADIQEWGWILSDPVRLGVPWAITVIAAGAAVVRSGWPPRWDYTAMIAALAIASFKVSRLDAFLGIAVVLFLAPQFIRARDRAPARVADADPRTPPVLIAATLAVVAALVSIAGASTLLPLARCLAVGGPWAPDLEVARVVERNQLRGRMLTWFDWGEYAIWHFGPDLLVSIDGRRETVYSSDTIQRHRGFYAADDTALLYLKQLAPDYIWIPKTLPIAARLATEGWTPIVTGPKSVVLTRRDLRAFDTQPSSGGLRCFPDQ